MPCSRLAQKKPLLLQGPLERKSLATCYSPGAFRPSTIAAEELNDRVRNGNGCDLLAIITRQIDENWINLVVFLFFEQQRISIFLLITSFFTGV